MAQRINEDKHLPVGEVGSGHYSDNTIGCFDVVTTGTPLILKAASLLFDETKFANFVIVDFGCADAGTSLPLLYKLITKVKERSASVQISIYYEDQPTNDFNSTFRRVHGYIPSEHFYLETFQDVYVFATGTSFYKQVLPRDSINLAYSFTAMHWLSSTPAIHEVKNHLGGVHHTQFAQDSPGVELFTNQAKEDFDNILRLRHLELAPGGFFVLVIFCIDKDGYYLGNTGKSQNMYKVMDKIWTSLETDGLITELERKNTVLGNYYRTEEELKRPFVDPQSSIYCKLKLISFETKVVPCAYYNLWESKAITDPKEYAKKYVPTMRTWSDSSFRSALDKQRTESEKTKIVDEFYSRYENYVASDPTDHAMDYVHAYMVIQKESSH